ncbi:unnamed protein product, partial [Mesorhabditis belari]|uniref:Protein kinase domain-containing protein n=1 Tax=Mesorhabditis belari TaxID=2138241 RepID=A0AAF3EV15_9BILA
MGNTFLCGNKENEALKQRERGYLRSMCVINEKKLTLDQSTPLYQALERFLVSHYTSTALKMVAETANLAIVSKDKHFIKYDLTIKLPAEFEPDLEDVHYRDPRLAATPTYFHQISEGVQTIVIAAKMRVGNVIENGQSISKFERVAAKRRDLVLLERKAKTAQKMNQRHVKVDHRHMAALLVQIFRALDYLHQRGVIHRDLSSSNIGLNKKDFRIKLLDFGVSGFMNRQKELTEGLQSTPLYQPLEKILNARYDHGVDIWAAGLIGVEMLGMKLMNPTREDQKRSLFPVKSRILNVVGIDEDKYQSIFGDQLSCETPKKAILDQELDKAFERLENENRVGLTRNDLRSLLKSIFIVNPHDRFSANECLNSPYLQVMEKKLPKNEIAANDLTKKNARDQKILLETLHAFSKRI